MAQAVTVAKQHSLFGKILIVEDDTDLREALSATLELENFQVLAAPSAEQAIEILVKNNDVVMIVSDVNMGEMSGHDLLKVVKRDYPQIPVLLITAYASISESVDAIRGGAIDYLVKPFEPKLLIEMVRKTVGDGLVDMDEPIAVAESSRQLLALAARVAQADSTALIMGESGTGKEVLARYIHKQSPRKNQPFVAINCAAIPENMLEAMLFGHEKGAYTGAYSSAPGKFEQANGGTLLLDEISEMDMGLQAKLLRVLQEKEVERLGGRKSIQLDVRVIATSNRDMREEVMQGRFREDLYFRLSILPLRWAPLRDRIEDILPLAEKLLKRHAMKQHRSHVVLTQDAQVALQTYVWPGNVRELDNVIQRALILQADTQIAATDLALEQTYAYSQKPPLVQTIRTEDFQDSSSVAGLSGTHTEAEQNSNIQGEAILGKDLRKREFEIIINTLREERGSKKNTAERLGISPRTLRYKIARLREEGYNLDAMPI